MGYYVRIDECSVSIPKSEFAKACKHLEDGGFLSNTERMSGGTFGKGEGERWYSWVQMDNLREFVSNGDLPAVFNEFGFMCFYDEDGGISDLFYDRKTGDEEVLLNELAPFFREGNYIQWQGEDREVWRHEFRGGGIKHMVRDIAWREMEP
jgi:hypothetical protein